MRDLENLELDELETIEGGLDFGCVGIVTGASALVGAPAGGVGAALTGAAGFFASLYLCA